MRIWFNFYQFVSGTHSGEGLGGRNPSLLEAKAMLLTADIIRQLSSGKNHSGSNQ